MGNSKEVITTGGGANFSPRKWNLASPPQIRQRTMYAIIDKTSQFVASGKKHNFYVEKAVFGELGWSVKITKDKAKAKRYKTYTGAYKFLSKVGAQYEVVKF